MTGNYPDSTDLTQLTFGWIEGQLIDNRPSTWRRWREFCADSKRAQMARPGAPSEARGKRIR